MKIWKFPLFITLSFTSLLVSCGSSKQTNFKDLPEICRHYDFSENPAMAETCGIRQTRYKSYKNIPTQRYLIRPKGTTLVKTAKGVELRLPNTIPILLNKDMNDQIDFSEDAKPVMIKNKYDYREIYPKNGSRIKLFKLSIPDLRNKFTSHCFSVPRTKVDHRVKAMSGHTIYPITCKEFQQLVDLHK